MKYEAIYDLGEEVSQEDFDIMCAQNALSFLLEGGIVMKQTDNAYYNDVRESGGEIYYYYDDNGDFCQLTRYGENPVSAYYHGYDFWYDETLGRYIISPYGGTDYKVHDDMFDNTLVMNLIYVDKLYIVDEGEETITVATGYRENTDESMTRITMDKGTFRIFEIDSVLTYYEEDGTVNVTHWNSVYEYGKDIEIPSDLRDLKDAFGGETRKITVVDADGESSYGTVTYEIPAGWELMPYASATYMDENFSKPYEYPGDEGDYTIYISYAAG